MPLIAAKCPSCGGAIQLDSDNAFGFCLYCGTRVILSEAIPQRFKIEGFQALEDKLKNAETYIKFSENDKAFFLLTQITEEYTSDYRAWWLLAKLKYWTAYALDTASPDFGLVDSLSPSKEFQYAVELADEDAKKILFAEQERYLQELRKNWLDSQRKIEMTVRGDYTFINHSHMENCGFEVIHGELYFWEDKRLNPPDLRLEKVNGSALKIRFINNGKIAIGDKFFIVSAATPKEYVRFHKSYEELKRTKRGSVLGLVIGMASLIVFVIFLLLKKG